MKKTIIYFALLVSYTSFGQISFLDDNIIRTKYPTIQSAYLDINGNLADPLSTAKVLESAYFQGDFGESDAIFIQYYLGELINNDYTLTGIKSIVFEKYDENSDRLNPEISIHYWKNGKIKDVKYNSR